MEKYMPPYITTYNIKPPTTETKSAPSVAAPVKSGTAVEIAKSLFRRGPVYTHGAGGLIATVDANQANSEE
jgi:hypothetical protein